MIDYCNLCFHGTVLYKDRKYSFKEKELSWSKHVVLECKYLRKEGNKSRKIYCVVPESTCIIFLWTFYYFEFQF